MTVDWRSEEMRPFAKIYSSRSIKTLVEKYFYTGPGNKEDEKAKVKTLVAGLSTFSPDGTYRKKPPPLNLFIV